MLTRRQMEDVIRGGGSVLIGGTVVSTIAELPSEVTLAKGNPELTGSTREKLVAEQKRIAAELEQLDGPGSTKAPSSKETELEDGFPGKEPLEADGRFVTYEALDAASEEDILSVHLIGKSTLADIRTQVAAKLGKK